MSRDETLAPPEEDKPSGRGGRIEVEDRPGKGKVEEASEESFPASDAPSHTPAGYVDHPPPSGT